MTRQDAVQVKAREIARSLKEQLGSYLKPSLKKEPKDVLSEAFEGLLQDISHDYGIIGGLPLFSINHVGDDVWEFDLDPQSYVSWIEKIVQLENNH